MIHKVIKRTAGKTKYMNARNKIWKSKRLEEIFVFILSFKKMW